MAYVVRYGSQLLHQRGHETRCVSGASLSSDAYGISTFEFTIPRTHPLAQTIKIRDYSNLVSLKFDDTELFTGFVTSKREDIYGSWRVTCKDLLQWLADFDLRLSDLDLSYSDKPQRIRAGELFSEVIQIYNNAVPAERRFATSYSDGTWVYGVDTSSPSKAFDVIAKHIVEPFGYMVKHFESGSSHAIQLVTSYSETNTQTIRFGENMTDYEWDESDDDMFTAVYPTGGTVPEYDESRMTGMLDVVSAAPAGSTTITVSGVVVQNDTLTYTSSDGAVMNLKVSRVTASGSNSVITVPRTSLAIPAGDSIINLGPYPKTKAKTGSADTKRVWTLHDMADGTYSGMVVKGNLVCNPTAINSYGLITKPMSVSDATSAWDILNAAITELAGAGRKSESLSAGAVDVALYNPSYTHLTAGERVMVVSAPHGVSRYMTVTAIDLDIDDPSSTTYVLGSPTWSVTGKIGKTNREISALRSELASMSVNMVTTSDLGGIYNG